MTSLAQCRFCSGSLSEFLDLGMSPLCESFLRADQLNQMEPFYPLVAHICLDCRLVQLQEYVAPADIFRDYAYFAGFSTSWLNHARQYVTDMTRRFALNGDSRVVELGSNDGYLLQFFVAQNISVLGIDPAANVAKAAEQRGVPTRVAFFGRSLAEELVGEGIRADLIAANNVLAQVPDLNSFVAGIKVLLNSSGVCTIEFPHLLSTMEGRQFDQFYHEHFSYFSAETAEAIFQAHGLRIFDVEELPSHGGSLRIFACHHDDISHPTLPSVANIVEREQTAGLHQLETYAAFANQVRTTKRTLLSFLVEVKNQAKSIAAYGAPGKGNTLLNYCGIRTDFLDYTVGRNSHKHGKFLPGTHIPIFPPEHLAKTKPDYILILPWNLRREIAEQLAYTREWGAKLVVPVPEIEVF